ncbi:uncharacterized protein PGTG_15686 [Puccinia graminis f. sp. tritici CRL 75-36-700-3]|uniref:Uncharacterized protein n=1 Tax=Puccinia graminis f. sp. tritici (strain CRL 75-36-700-3 / race SCCL) TaxID=418459 RepID=E3KZ12_PUCGT|nr:uncharacterized protein PGTG_15686 [Puccinia graminis f. sp. tritici CRL 75-36-700-3]EFP89537.2 hypothetical protein PGTG_15686 [Puccinia graminis f. sp. tritici CRL 75-36-700-3]
MPPPSPFSLLLQTSLSPLSHTQVSSCLPQCPPLSLPRTPLVTPPTPVGPGTPPAALGQVSHRPFRLWLAPNPASAPWCPLLLVAPPQYTLKPHSAVGRELQSPPVPGFPAASFSEPCAFGLLFHAFLRLGKLDFLPMHHRFPQLACVVSAPQAFRISREHSACTQTNWPKLWSRRTLTTTTTLKYWSSNSQIFGTWLRPPADGRLQVSAKLSAAERNPSPPLSVYTLTGQEGFLPAAGTPSLTKRDSSWPVKEYNLMYTLTDWEESLLAAESYTLSAARRIPSRQLRVYTLNGGEGFLPAGESVHSHRPRGIPLGTLTVWEESLLAAESYTLSTAERYSSRPVRVYTLNGREGFLSAAESPAPTPNLPGCF